MTLQDMMQSERKRIHKIYTIVQKQGSEKGIWLEIGVATENRDGSLSGKLDALPVGGTLHIREYVPRRRDQSDSGPYQNRSL